MSEKTTIRSRYKREGRFTTESGRPTHNEYEIRIDKNGHKELYKTGETNLYEKIQAELKDTLIENIIERVSRGETDALEVRKTAYLDLTKAPKSLAEAQNQISQIKSSFYTLPIEIRAKYNHSAEQYVAKFGTKEWEKTLFPDKPKKLPTIKEAMEEKKTEEIKKGESKE